jgi:hypothetical protein
MASDGGREVFDRTGPLRFWSRGGDRAGRCHTASGDAASTKGRSEARPR